MGPNLKKLAAHKMALDAIPKDTKGGFMENLLKGVAFIQDQERFRASARASQEWARQAVAAVRGAAEPNKWKDADDEVIAGELLRVIEERKRTQRQAEPSHDAAALTGKLAKSNQKGFVMIKDKDNLARTASKTIQFTGKPGLGAVGELLLLHTEGTVLIQSMNVSVLEPLIAAEGTSLSVGAKDSPGLFMPAGAVGTLTEGIRWEGQMLAGNPAPMISNEEAYKAFAAQLPAGTTPAQAAAAYASSMRSPGSAEAAAKAASEMEEDRKRKGEPALPGQTLTSDIVGVITGGDITGGKIKIDVEWVQVSENSNLA